MKIRNLILGFGIFLVYLLTLYQGIDSFFPEPKYENYCFDIIPNDIQNIDVNNCVLSQVLKNKAQSCFKIKGNFVYNYNEMGCPIDGYCDECRIGYEHDLDSYFNNIFVYIIILGFAVLIVGLYFLKKEPVSSALIASSIWTFIYGVFMNWRNFGNSWRFLILFVLLIILIFLTLKINETKKRKGWKLKFWMRK